MMVSQNSLIQQQLMIQVQNTREERGTNSISKIVSADSEVDELRTTNYLQHLHHGQHDHYHNQLLQQHQPSSFVPTSHNTQEVRICLRGMTKDL